MRKSSAPVCKCFFFKRLNEIQSIKWNFACVLTSVSDLISFPSSCSCVLFFDGPFRSVHSLLPFLVVVLGGLWFSNLLQKLINNFILYFWAGNWRNLMWIYLDCGEARSVCGVSASVGAVDDALLVGRRLFTGLAFSALPFEPSRSTLCRVSWSNGLRKCRFLGASNDSGRYICGKYGVKPLKPELLGFINELHSCFKLFNGALADGDPPDELFLWCRRFISNCASCDCDCAAAKRPCSVDKPLTCRNYHTHTQKKQKKNIKPIVIFAHVKNC